MNKDIQKLSEQILNNEPADFIWGPEYSGPVDENGMVTIRLISRYKTTDGDLDMITIDSALKTTANKKLSKEIEDELNKTDPKDPEQVIAAAKSFAKETEKDQENDKKEKD